MKRGVLGLIRLYQKYFSLDTGLMRFLLPSGRVCRFDPTCSEYTYEAISRYGIIRGSFKGLGRIIHCHPLTKN